MERGSTWTLFALAIMVTLLWSTLPRAAVAVRVVAEEPVPEKVAPQAAAAKIYLPAVGRPPGPPQFAISSPLIGSSISGTLFFAVQPDVLGQITTVAFKAGTTDLGTDTTPADGFRIFLNARTLPAGQQQLSATATGPGGTATQSISVNVVLNPPSSASIGARGGVLGSPIGSTIMVPPGAVPDGTTVAITEKSQQQVSAETGINWDAMGVTFLGAQDVQTSAEFTKPLAVSSAGFGNRVQPGQAVVNYRIMPDADGDGIGELVFINTASVAPNNDVISDPVPQLAVSNEHAQTALQSSFLPAHAHVPGGRPGANRKIQGTDVQELALIGNAVMEIAAACLPRPGQASSGITGMGSAPAPGGPGCGSAGGGPSVVNRGRVNSVASGLTAGRYIVKIYPRSESGRLLTPFTGVSDPDGYFFIPLIPAGEPFRAVAIDTVTEAQRTFDGVGPALNDFVVMSFLFSPDDVARGTFPINIGDTVSNGVPADGAGNLEITGNRDRYSFSAAAGQAVYVQQLGAVTGAWGANFTMTDSAGTVIADTCVGCGDPGAKTLALGGTYTITINKDRRNLVGTYSFQIRDP